MGVQAVVVDLAVLFGALPGGEIGVFPDGPVAVDQWRQMGMDVYALTAGGRYVAELKCSAALRSIRVFDHPAPYWRQATNLSALADSIGLPSAQVAIVAAKPPLHTAARQAGMIAVGVMRGARIMAVLDGVWVDDMTVIRWPLVG